MENHINGECSFNKEDILLCNKKKSTTVNTELLKPFKHLTSVPGKNIRKILINVLNHWMKIPQDKATEISEVINVLHQFSLLIDDIEDKSTLRRGLPTAHTVFGLVNTSLSATYIDLLNLERVIKLNKHELVDTYIRTSQRIWEGQGMELYWRDHFVCPTEQEYLQMISRKTGGLFGLTKDLMLPFSTRKIELDRFLTAFGLYFQILDDYQNLNSKVYFENKGFCEDITEGKFSFPIIHAINSNRNESKIIKEIIVQRTNDVDRKKYCLSLIESCGSFEYTRNRLTDLKNIIFEELNKLEENPYFDKFFANLPSVI